MKYQASLQGYYQQFETTKRRQPNYKENKMATSKDDILKSIEEMSVMELVELISAIEEKFGVTAAAAVAAAPAAGGGDADAPAAEETFHIELFKTPILYLHYDGVANAN